jgi:hypothetical protein
VFCCLGCVFSWSYCGMGVETQMGDLGFR